MTTGTEKDITTELEQQNPGLHIWSRIPGYIENIKDRLVSIRITDPSTDTEWSAEMNTDYFDKDPVFFKPGSYFHMYLGEITKKAFVHIEYLKIYYTAEDIAHIQEEGTRLSKKLEVS